VPWTAPANSSAADAIAAFWCVFINLFGGTIIRRGTATACPLADAGRTYALLTIGDDWWRRIPALLLSVAAAISGHARVSRPHDMSSRSCRRCSASPSLGRHGRHLRPARIIPGSRISSSCRWARCARRPPTMQQASRPGSVVAVTPAGCASDSDAQQKNLSGMMSRRWT